MLGPAPKSPEAFRTISEVAADLDVPQHVLRFWESKFVQIKPLKRGGGRRYYRPDDIDLLRGICALLYSDGLTIKGVQKLLRERGVRHVAEIGRSRRGTESFALPSLSPTPRPDGRTADSNVHPFRRPERALASDDRDRLESLLADLLDMKQAIASAKR